jgi:hypothetical protein
MSDTITWDYPKELHDEDGYPTPEALDYIKNWGVTYGQLDTKFGSKFGNRLYNELVEYIRDLWWFSQDGIEYQDGLLEIHTLGWSGNEDIVAELKNTDLWMFKFKAQTAGGHYYFKIDSESEHDWYIVKSKDK